MMENNNTPIKGKKAYTPDGYLRYTVAIELENLEKIRAVAYWENKSVMKIFNEILTEYFKDKDIHKRPSI